MIQERQGGDHKEILIRTLKGIIKVWKNERKTYVTIKYLENEIFPTQITFRYR